MRNKLFILLLILAIGKLSFSQTPSNPGDYVVDNNIDKFVGTWMNISNGQQVIITLKKVKYYFPAPLNFYEDVLIGCYQYSQNNIVVESSLKYINSPDLNQHFTVFGKTSETNSFIADMQFIDANKKKTGQLTLTINSSNQGQLNWKLAETPGVKIGVPNYGFAVPLNLTMLAQ